MKISALRFLFTALVFLPLIPSFAEEPPAPLEILATNTIIADVARQVGGEYVRVESLLAPDTDPHSFQPAPSDVSRIVSCDALLMNGLGLEQSLATLIANSGSRAVMVELSAGLPARRLGRDYDGHHDHDHGDFDPHVWFDPNLVMLWAGKIADALAGLDSLHAGVFYDNAERYRAQLVELDAWIRAQVETIPPGRRKLVSDHDQFGYFCDRYGLESAGAVIPGFSTLSEPSARELAALEDAIRAQKVTAVFVGNTVSPVLAKRVADDTGARLITLYTGSLTSADGAAPTYLAFMRHDVATIVDALK
ncbi:MAG: metal ABC transporter substrate-binding protein [bacterium]|nr:metal ABC transporter substrate-binding protein [bacterium]